MTPMWGPSMGDLDGAGGVAPVAAGTGAALANVTTDGPETPATQGLQALAQRTAETAATLVKEPSTINTTDTVSVSGRSMMVTRLFGDNPELALTPDAASPDDMRLAAGKPSANVGPPPVHGLDVAGKYGATQATHPSLQAVVATGVLSKLSPAQLAAMTPKNLAALLVFQFLTAADRQVLSQVYEYAQARNLDLALVDALAFDVAVFRSAGPGSQLIRDHVGLFFSADGRAVRFGFTPDDEAIAVRILTSKAMADTAIPHDWLRFQLDPGVAIRTPRVPLAFLEQVVYALSASGADGATDPDAVLAPRPNERLEALRANGSGHLPAVNAAAAEFAEDGEAVTTLLQAQRYRTRVEQLTRALPLSEVAASVAAPAAAAQAIAQTPGLSAGLAAPVLQSDAGTRMVAGLLQVFTQHDKQLLAAMYAGAETTYGPASPEINKLDLLVRQMALAAALGAVPGADDLRKGEKKKRRERQGKGEHDEPRGRDYREFNAWLEEESEAEVEAEVVEGEPAAADPPAEPGRPAAPGALPRGAAASHPAITADPASSIGPRFAQELEQFIEHRKLYG